MNITLHKASERGTTKIDWLDSKHSFSFGSYHDENNLHFGALRVLNDDIIGGGKGFGAHPHGNMEIVTIVLDGALEHNDSTGGSAVLSKGQAQMMSAGRGIVHSEMNHLKDKASAFLQIWVLPKEQDIVPKHEDFDLPKVKDGIETFVGLDSKRPINQDAGFSWGELSKGKAAPYSPQQGNGIYLFIIEGEVKVEDKTLSKRDAVSITDADSIKISSLSDQSTFLVIEVPMIEL